MSAFRKLNNPMFDPVIREKAAAAKRGRTFIGRGGNGEPTRPQLLLHAATGLPMEYGIGVPRTIPFPCPPRCYKVDLAMPEVKLAIEVDGQTHRSRKWRFLDKRKESILHALGWSVLRFWNEEVVQNPIACATEIAYTISELKAQAITLPQAL